MQAIGTGETAKKTGGRRIGSKIAGCSSPRATIGAIVLSRWVMTSFAGSLIGLTAGGACSREATEDALPLLQLGVAWCERQSTCGCASRSGTCERGDHFLFDNLSSRAEDRGLAFDPECGQRLVDLVQNASCDPRAALPRIGCDNFCRLYHGTLWEGQPCEMLPDFDGGRDCAQGLMCLDDCGPGLVCSGGVCTDPCRVTPPLEGQPCGPDCGPGLYCEPSPDEEGAGICRTLPAAGQPCTPENACVPEAWCDTRTDPAVCVASSELGEPCTGHLQCRSGHCPDGRCRQRLSEGEACTGNLRCDQGLACVDGVCQLELSLCEELPIRLEDAL